MPYYDLQCKNCGAIHENVFARIRDVESVLCHRCFSSTRVLLSPFTAVCDIEAYMDENLASPDDGGKPVLVKSKQHKRQILKEKGLYEKPNKNVRWV